MHYEQYTDHSCLREKFQTALHEQRNIVLQANGFIDTSQDFYSSVQQGLRRDPKQFECRFLYDTQGSKLYEEICKQPEYYPTRTETKILQYAARDISQQTGACHLVELGSGSSTKTDYLLSAYQERNTSVLYTPIDISFSSLRLAGKSIADKRDSVNIVGIHGTYNDSFPLIKYSSPVLLIFLGSSIGNFSPAEEHDFWHRINECLQIGDYFLLGIDLVKDIDILETAYNDAEGVTAAFTTNYFTRMNRELGCCLDTDFIEHIAFFNEKQSQIEIYAEFLKKQEICLKKNKAEERCFVQKGERIRIEISRKYKIQEVTDRLSGYGLEPLATYSDSASWFGLFLLEKVR